MQSIMSSWYLLNYVEELEVDDKVIELGASPAELVWNPEAARPHAMIGHQGCPEMDLTAVYDC